MKAAACYRTLVILPVLLAAGLLAGCAGVPPERYNQVQAELTEAHAVIADLEEKLRAEHSKVTEVQTQLQEMKARTAEIEKEFDLYRGHTLKSPEIRAVTDCVLPLNVKVRDTAVSAVAGVPSGISADSAAWKIWRAHYWISENIAYVSDPKGHEYLAYADETLETGGGDCDDFSTLLASMYESLGLDAAVSYIDTDKDGQSDHMTCLVYWAGDADSFLDEEKTILKRLRIKVPDGQVAIRFLEAADLYSELGKYQHGTWIIADPLMTDDIRMVGSVTREPYEIIEIIDVGE
jgi:outer membrane murein-binding lipoprotein Lpp